jgi:hypothetical protein
MNKTRFFLPALALLLSLSACDDDPNPLVLRTFDVRWYDDDKTGTQTVGDALTFDIEINTTDDDPDDQFITEWNFSYNINGKFGETLQGDDDNSNTVGFNAEVFIDRLRTPGGKKLVKGDVVEFRIWAIDNDGTEVEQNHRYILEE